MSSSTSSTSLLLYKSSVLSPPPPSTAGQQRRWRGTRPMHHQGRFGDVSSCCQEAVRPIDDVIFGAADPDDPRHASLDLELGSVQGLRQRVHILILVRTLVRVFLLVSIHVRDNSSPLHRPQPLPASAAVLPCSNRDRRRFSRTRGDCASRCNRCLQPLCCPAATTAAAAAALPQPPLRCRCHHCLHCSRSRRCADNMPLRYRSRRYATAAAAMLCCCHCHVCCRHRRAPLRCRSHSHRCQCRYRQRRCAALQCS